MEVVPTDEKNVRRVIRTAIGDGLGCYYGELLKEAIPSRFTDLLWRLDELDKTDSDKQD